MRALVTGAAGFIGSHLCHRLIEKGWSVIAIDDLSTGYIENVPEKNCKFIEMTIADYDELCTSLFDLKIDVVFHVAALARVQFSIAEPSKTNKANITGTLNVLQMAREFGVKRVVYSSSSSVYGDQETLPLTETMKPNPMSPYALQKLTGEYYCKLFWDIYGLETISLRYFNVFGERQNACSSYACLIPKTIGRLLRGEAPLIYGDGLQTRDFNYVSNVVDANIQAARTDNAGTFGQVINIGSGRSYDVNKIVKNIQGILGTDISSRHTDPVVEPRHTIADISLAGKLLDWKPSVGLQEGLERTCKYFSGDKNAKTESIKESLA